MNTNRLVNSNICKLCNLVNGSYVSSEQSQDSDISFENIGSVSSDEYFSDSYNSDTVNLSVVSGHNVAWSASKIMKDLCTCTDVNIHWCFITKWIVNKAYLLTNVRTLGSLIRACCQPPYSNPHCN